MFFALSASSFPLFLISPDELLDYLLGLVPSSAGPLAQAVLVSVSLLAAFLTVVQVWQIPPVSRRLAGDLAVAAESALPPIEPDQLKAFMAKLLSNNLSRTLLGGLAGLIAVTILGSLFQAPGLRVLDVEAYYLVLFVAFFLSLLFLSAIFRGLVEAGRSRIVLSRQAAVWPPPISHDGMSPFVRAGRRAGFWGLRSWYWLASFRAAVLIFSDTFFNVIQGKNRLQAAVLSDTVIDLHESLVEAAERTCNEIHEAMISALVRQGALADDQPHEDCVRVAVSLLSQDESKVYSITRERGSLSKSFPQGSISWIAAHASVARWYKPIYAESPAAVVFDNERGKLPEAPKKILLGQVSEHRSLDGDEAFVVLPMPWTCRGTSGPHRRGAIHISFNQSAFLDALWGGLESPRPMQPSYDGWRGLLVPTGGTSPAREGEVFLKAQVYELGFVLHQALDVLGEALGFFDDEVFNEYVQLRRHM